MHKLAVTQWVSAPSAPQFGRGRLFKGLRLARAVQLLYLESRFFQDDKGGSRPVSRRPYSQTSWKCGLCRTVQTSAATLGAPRHSSGALSTLSWPFFSLASLPAGDPKSTN